MALPIMTSDEGPLSFAYFVSVIAVQVERIVTASS